MEELAAVIHGQVVGSLVIGHRSRGERFTRAEMTALHAVAEQLGALMREAGLTHALQLSRERILGAREEERRRVRHDLHDGVGPALAAAAMQIDRIVARLSEGSIDPALRALGQEAADRLRATVVEVRRIVEDLRPAVLDELGLVEAVRHQAAGYGSLVDVDGDDIGVDLPAAVEVAAYRIANEAVTNAVRHANATRVEVRFAHEGDWLAVSISDDGVGLGTMESLAGHGLGLDSMRERVAELGGRFSIGPAVGVGTRIDVLLPQSVGTR